MHHSNKTAAHSKQFQRNRKGSRTKKIKHMVEMSQFTIKITSQKDKDENKCNQFLDKKKMKIDNRKYQKGKGV